MTPYLHALSVVALITIAGCNKVSSSSSGVPPSDVPMATASSAGMSGDDREAVTEAIKAHLRGNRGINMSAMDMTVGNVSISGDQAQADAEFRLKQGGTSMLVTYFLERHAGGWMVIRNQPNGAGQFAHPPMDKTHSSGAASPFSVATDWVDRQKPKQPAPPGSAHPQ